MSFIRSQGADLSDDDADDDEEDEDGWETVDDDEEAAEAEAGAGTLPVDQLFERALSVSATGADADPRYATAADGCAASAAPPKTGGGSSGGVTLASLLRKPKARTTAALSEATSIGFTMLRKLGWEGGGLGKAGTWRRKTMGSLTQHLGEGC